jgi:hypothetical protein
MSPQPYANPEAPGRNRPLDKHAKRATSWVSVIIGGLTALGAILIVTGIIGALVAMMLGAGQPVPGTAVKSTIAGLMGLFSTLFVAFLMGGYCAGRMARRAGVKHGLLVAALASVVTLILAGIGALVGTRFIENRGGVALPSLPADALKQRMGITLTVALILTRLIPFIAGALGGAWCAKTGHKCP